MGAGRRVAIVTGAGSGIGREVAVRLAAEGWSVVLVGRRAERLEETSALAGEGCVVVPADVGDGGQAVGVVDEALERFGRVDVLVNNAAVVNQAPLGETTADQLAATFAPNLFGPMLMVARLWPAFTARGGGRVINVSSAATRDPFPGLGVYAASKSALESLTRSIAAEGAAAGIESCSIVLGAVETRMLRSVVPRQQLPEDQTLDPGEVAAVIVQCATGRRRASRGTIELSK